MVKQDNVMRTHTGKQAGAVSQIESSNDVDMFSMNSIEKQDNNSDQDYQRISCVAM